jgi:hypothetical protein
MISGFTRFSTAETAGVSLPSVPALPLAPDPALSPHRFIGRNVRMQFGRQWYDGVVKDHDVSTDNELIWGLSVDTSASVTNLV